MLCKSADDAPALERAVARGGGRAWFVSGIAIQDDRFLRYLRETFEFQEVQNFTAIDVILLRKK